MLSRADRSRLPDIGPDPVFTLPEVVRHRLPCGLQVRTIEHATVPVVTFVMQIEGGAGADPRGREGLAAITADMADEGTGSSSAIDVSDALARIGAQYDIDVGPDATVFTLMTLARFAERGASLLADLLLRPSLREADFERVRRLRLDRLLQLKDLPPAVAERAFLRLLYGDHPYGHLPIGSPAALRDLRREEVVAFHAGTMRPSAATLIVAGASSHGELLRIAERAFGDWPDGPAPVGPAAADVHAVASPPRLALVPREGAAQSELRIGQLSARRNTPDYSALLVMNALLGGQFVSRVNLKLREEKGYTYGARTGFDWRRGMAPFSLQTSVHTAATADAVRDALGEIESLRGSRPPTEIEMAVGKASLTRGYARNFETAQQVARSVAQLALYDLPDSYFEEFIPRVHAVGRDDVMRVARDYLEPSRATTLIVGDYQAIGDSLAAVGLGDPQILPGDG